MSYNIPFCKASIGDEEVQAVTNVLKSGWLAAGEQTEKFEREFAEYVGVKYAIFTNSCTSALKMAYKWALEYGYNEFYYPKNTFCATYAAGYESGCSEMYPYDEPKKEIHYKAGAQVLVHYGGEKVDGVPCLIEDSAHRIEPNDPLVGKIRCYSFYVTKNMTTGSGGMLVTNDKEIYEQCRLYWRDGLSSSTADRQLRGGWDYRVLKFSGGYDGNDISAALGLVQLKRLPEFTERRNALVARYNAAFSQSWGGNHLYPYFVQTEAQVGELIQFLASKGISAKYHYPGTGWLGVSLPLYPDLTNEEQDYVITTVNSFN